jgi:thymidine kinase
MLTNAGYCVLVDESQFLTREQVHELSEVVDELDIPVLCYGLRTDFRGELFSGRVRNWLSSTSTQWMGWRACSDAISAYNDV